IVNERIEGGLYHINNKDGSQIGLIGAAPFSSPGLGFTNSSSIYINGVIDDAQTNQKLLNSFDSIWSNKELLKDVKKEVLEQLELLYAENSPEFIYFVTLYNIFKDFLEGNKDFRSLQQKIGFENTVI